MDTNEPEGFEEAWEIYPRKVGKGDARRAWLKVRPNAALRARILAAIRRMSRCEQWTKNGGQYIPHFSTFLNREGWEDQPDIALPAAPARQIVRCSVEGCRGEAAAVWGGKCQAHFAQSRAPQLFAVK